jgi:hypothetical protein
MYVHILVHLQPYVVYMWATVIHKESKLSVEGSGCDVLGMSGPVTVKISG